MGNLFWLTDAQMARLELFSPKSHGKPRVDDRRPGQRLHGSGCAYAQSAKSGLAV
jgi:hypothetical protein